MLHLGAKPVLVDVAAGRAAAWIPTRWSEPSRPRTRAIVPVHLAGAPCEMDALLELASRYGLKIVEDAAHALPTRYKGRLVGSIGDLTVFSFYAIKNLTTGEGGHDHHRLRPLRQPARAPAACTASAATPGSATRRRAPGTTRSSIPGYKYNMTDLNAALGLQQLQKLDMFHAVRHVLREPLQPRAVRSARADPARGGRQRQPRLAPLHHSPATSSG